MAIISRPSSDEYRKGFDEVFMVEVSTHCPNCHKPMKYKIKKADFEARVDHEALCPHCGMLVKV